MSKKYTDNTIRGLNLVLKRGSKDDAKRDIMRAFQAQVKINLSDVKELLESDEFVEICKKQLDIDIVEVTKSFIEEEENSFFHAR